MRTQIARDIEHQVTRGEQPTFTLKDGLVGLAEWDPASKIAQIKNHNKKIMQQFLDQLLKMPPEAFEHLIMALMLELGCDPNDTEVTQRSNDGGIDVYGVLDVGGLTKVTMAIQVKRWSGPVSRPTLQQVRGSLSLHERGLLITTGGATPHAEEDEKRNDRVQVKIVKGPDLVELLVNHNLGITRLKSGRLRIKAPTRPTSPQRKARARKSRP